MPLDGHLRPGGVIDRTIEMSPGGDIDDIVIIEERDVGNRATRRRTWDSKNGLLGVYALSPSTEPDCRARWPPMSKWSFDRSR